MSSSDAASDTADVFPPFPVSRLLLAWQAHRQQGTGGDKLASLCDAVRPIIEDRARVVFLRARVADLSCVDETTTLVFDHLWRLSESSAGFGSVKPFDAGRAQTGSTTDPGTIYIQWLSKHRALDVLRARRRLARREMPLDDCSHADQHEVAIAGTAADEGDSVPEARMPLEQAIVVLDERSQCVLGLLLQGQSQTQVAREIGVCEGTVSRIRSRAIGQLQLLMRHAK